MIGNLTFDQLRILVAVADTGSFSGAGRLLGRVQSAMSQSISTLETTQNVSIFDRGSYRPQLTEIGQVLVDQARIVLASVDRFEAVAASNRDGIEADLTVSIDPLVPSAPFVDAMRGLVAHFPDLPVSFSKDGLGGSLRRLRAGNASIAICTLLPHVPDDIIAHPLFRFKMIPVVAPSHPLAQLKRPVNLGDLDPHVQLVLSDPVEPAGPNYGLASARLWRFVDLSRRMDFLCAGFGWCRMPDHSVTEAISTGKLCTLEIENDTAPQDGITIYAAHRRDDLPGLAGRYLLETIQTKMG